MNDYIKHDYHIYMDGPYLGVSEGNLPKLLLLTRLELLKIRKCIDITLDRYDELEWDNDEIHRQNNLVIEKCQAEIREKSRKKPKEVKTRDTRHLYLIHNTVQNTLKIGISVNPTTRLKTLQLSTGDKLTIIFDIKEKAYLERKLHKEFAKLRLSSEWFKYDEKIINRFTELQWG